MRDKLFELNDWTAIMRQSAYTINEWLIHAEKAGFKDPEHQLKYAELCLGEFRSAAQCKMVDALCDALDSFSSDICESVSHVVKR